MLRLEAAITHALKASLAPTGFFVPVLLASLGGVPIRPLRSLHALLCRWASAVAAIPPPRLAPSAVQESLLAALAGPVEEDVSRHLVERTKVRHQLGLGRSSARDKAAHPLGGSGPVRAARLICSTSASAPDRRHESFRRGDRGAFARCARSGGRPSTPVHTQSIAMSAHLQLTPHMRGGPGGPGGPR